MDGFAKTVINDGVQSFTDGTLPAQANIDGVAGVLYTTAIRGDGAADGTLPAVALDFETDYVPTNIEIAQFAPEVLVEPSDANVQVAQFAPEVLVAPTDTNVQIAQFAIEVLVENVQAQPSNFWPAILRMLGQQ